MIRIYLITALDHKSKSQRIGQFLFDRHYHSLSLFYSFFWNSKSLKKWLILEENYK